MKFVTPIIALIILGFTGCNTTEKYAQNNQAGQRWLSRHTLDSAISVSGLWQSDDWGGTSLKQTGRAITGTLGRYDVKGVASGRRAYLLLSSGGWTYYTAVLTRSGDDIEGFYSYSVPFDVADQRALNLVRIRN